ncbi:MAG: PIG-L family deacetylase [Rubellimicrobium sp.]|nr:PIG-L family deacetylase [Rubellimicrobium sp.]
MPAIHAPARLAAREAAPALLRLHRALSRLSGVLTVMNSGAHPDDEQSGLLAWLRFGLGHRVVIACSTRGEGGQNALGPARGGLLGLIRTREMEEAARVLDCDVAWLGFGPNDPVHDFGFSKDGDATFARWGEARVVERLARAFRQYRPDVVIPTFLDVPGQHGHHRAMTRAALAAIAPAADPSADPGDDLPPWQVTHLYLPAWSGGGGTYDDTEPPPEATLTVTAGALDPATGTSYAEIGEWSRRRHATQGMGTWHDTPQREWRLHLAGGAPETRLAQSLPATLAELAPLCGPATADLAEAAAAITEAQAAFPAQGPIIARLADADRALERAQALLPPETAAAHGHRLTRKRREVGAALAEAAGLAPVASATILPKHGRSEISVTLHQPDPHQAQEARARLQVEGAPAGAEVALAGPATDCGSVIADDLALASQFRAGFDPLGGNGPVHVTLTARIAGRPVSIGIDPEPGPLPGPAAEITLRPSVLIRRRGDTGVLAAMIGGGAATITPPPGWQVTQQDARLSIIAPEDSPAGRVDLIPRIGGRQAVTVTRASHPHTGTVMLCTPAVLPVLTLDVNLPEGARIAYVGAGDSVGLWLKRIGLQVTILDQIAPDEDFARFTTVVAGVVAFGARPDLAAATERLHAFTQGGGHLVTLYQRPDQGWDAVRTPPLPLTVGTPSLRWRVTDPAAPVTILAPDHPLLAGPNRITAADFDGWDKERGLYFAAAHDPAYVELLAMSDAGEAPLTGSLVSAGVGAGRHTHTGLVLHHQLDRLVPGAFRLMANLVQAAPVIASEAKQPRPLTHNIGVAASPSAPRNDGG